MITSERSYFADFLPCLCIFHLHRFYNHPSVFLVYYLCFTEQFTEVGDVNDNIPIHQIPTKIWVLHGIGHDGCQLPTAHLSMTYIYPLGGLVGRPFHRVLWEYHFDWKAFHCCCFSLGMPQRPYHKEQQIKKQKRLTNTGAYCSDKCNKTGFAVSKSAAFITVFPTYT